jgi:hypothetical protein
LGLLVRRVGDDAGACLCDKMAGVNCSARMRT